MKQHQTTARRWQLVLCASALFASGFATPAAAALNPPINLFAMSVSNVPGPGGIPPMPMPLPKRISPLFPMLQFQSPAAGTSAKDS